MRRTILAAVVGAIALMVAAGVAWAATIQCQDGQQCVGTEEADTITGTEGGNNIDARAGRDSVDAAGGRDFVQGGLGEDIARGGEGDDYLLWGGTFGMSTIPPYAFLDAGDDVVRGGKGNDAVFGGYGQGGVDEVYGGDGDDRIESEQRGDEGGLYSVTREIINCGPGRDTVFFDEGLDEVKANCEIRNPPLEGERTGARGDYLPGGPGLLSPK